MFFVVAVYFVFVVIYSPVCAREPKKKNKQPFTTLSLKEELIVQIYETFNITFHFFFSKSNSFKSLFFFFLLESTTNNLSFSSFPSSRAITASSRCVWVSQPSMLSGPATTSCGTQPASCVAPAKNYWWT